MTSGKKAASPVLVMIAFAIVYLVWGSTYFFIQKAIQDIPPLLLGALRFCVAGVLMLAWCIIKGEKLGTWQQIKPAVVSGLLLLLVGNGGVIWAERTLPSSLVAVMVSSAPLWFVLLDKSKWKENLSSRQTIVGLIVGFLGVILLFCEQAVQAISASGGMARLAGLIIVIIGSVSWSAGSLYSKYNSSAPATVHSAWQMLAAGIAFIPCSLINNEWNSFHWHNVSAAAWFSLVYLVVMGSLVAYSAYVWLLQVRPATQVSTYAYVNPVVAVLLGVFFAGESMNLIQWVGLAVILGSVLLINRGKYQKEKTVRLQPAPVEIAIPEKKMV